MGKKITTIILIIFLSNLLLTPVYAASTPEVYSPSAILIDSATGRILYEKNAHETMYPASITKIITAILALEKGDLNDVITASPNAVLSIPYGSSNIGILPGEELTLEQLLQGLLIASANEGANVIGEHISGSVDEFIKLMNQRAIELGAKNTHFVNANGLHDENHYTTAYDMSLITRHAMTIPKFRELVKIDYMVMPPTNKYTKDRYLSNTNLLINRHRNTSQSTYLYEPAIGIKTGYTSKANHTLVAAAQKDGREYISVVLGSKIENSKNYSYVDTIELFEYGFDYYSFQTLAKPGDIVEESTVIEAKNQEHVVLQSDRALEVLLPKDYDTNEIVKEITLIPDIRAPITKGDVLGFATYIYKDEVLGKINLIADRNIEQEPMEIIKNKAVSAINTLWFKIAAGTLAFIIILILLLLIRKRLKKKRSSSFMRNKRKTSYINRHKKW